MLAVMNVIDSDIDSHVFTRIYFQSVFIEKGTVGIAFKYRAEIIISNGQSLYSLGTSAVGDLYIVEGSAEVQDCNSACAGINVFQHYIHNCIISINYI